MGHALLNYIWRQDLTQDSLCPQLIDATVEFEPYFDLRNLINVFLISAFLGTCNVTCYSFLWHLLNKYLIYFLIYLYIYPEQEQKRLIKVPNTTKKTQVLMKYLCLLLLLLLFLRLCNTKPVGKELFWKDFV